MKGNGVFGIDLKTVNTSLPYLKKRGSSHTAESSAGSFTGISCSEVLMTSVLQIETVTAVIFKRHSFQLLLTLVNKQRACRSCIQSSFLTPHLLV